MLETQNRAEQHIIIVLVCYLGSDGDGDGDGGDGGGDSGIIKYCVVLQIGEPERAK